MEPDTDVVMFEAPTPFRGYKSGKIDRLQQPLVLPAGVHKATGVTSKNVVLDVDTYLSVCLYLPKLQEDPGPRVLNGGAFLIESTDSATYHNYVNALTAAASVLTVSVNYGL